MADIVSFPDETGRRTPDLSEPDAGEPATGETPRAEIVIFPGIRIERQDFSLADRLPRRRENSPQNGDEKPHHGRS